MELLREIVSDPLKRWMAAALVAMYVPAQVFLIVAFVRDWKRAKKELGE